MSGKINWTCAYYYPFFLGATCFLITLYKFFLPPFILLLKPFLLIIFTILLLAFLLRFGRPNSVLKKDKNEKLTRKSSMKLELGKRDVIRVRKVESFRSNPNIRSRRTFKGTTVKAIAPDDKGFKEESRAIGEDDVNPIGAASVSSSSSPDEDHVNKISETEDTQQSSEKLPACDHENIADRHEDACATKTENVESCLGSPWCRVEHPDGRFDSEFNRVESCDLSAENGAGMGDKVDPQFPEDKLKDAATEQKHMVDDGGVKVESGKKDDGDVEGAREEKNERNKVSITWTADDQRNLMDLGDSEHERSRRLESLIAKRKARKAMERNLVDLDDNTEALPSISIGTKRNPFDLPYDFDDSLPGSAPSRLLPRFNLFDLHCAEEEDGDNLGHKSLVTLPQRDVYRRHESFTIGISFYENFKQENNYFVKETKESGDEVSDSKFSFTSESDTVSVTSFQEGLSQHGKELAGQDCQCSEHVKPMDAEFAMNINNDHEAQASEDAIPDDSSQESISSSLITYTDRPELKNPMDPNNLHEAHAIEDFGVVQDESSQESMSVSSSPITYADRGEMADENYEADSIAHDSGSLQDLGESTLSSNPMPVNCYAVNEVAHQVVPSQIVELDNHHSPTSTDKSNSDSAPDETRNISDKGNSNSKESDRTGECSTVEFMVENGPASREMSKSKELDVSDDKVSGVEDLDCPKLPSLPEPEIKQGIHHQVLPSDEIALNESS